jgi:hypothetical protein
VTETGLRQTERTRVFRSICVPKRIEPGIDGERRKREAVFGGLQQFGRSCARWSCLVLAS